MSLIYYNHSIIINDYLLKWSENRTVSYTDYYADFHQSNQHTDSIIWRRLNMWKQSKSVLGP